MNEWRNEWLMEWTFIKRLKSFTAANFFFFFKIMQNELLKNFVFRNHTSLQSYLSSHRHTQNHHFHLAVFTGTHTLTTKHFKHPCDTFLHTVQHKSFTFFYLTTLNKSLMGEAEHVWAFPNPWTPFRTRLNWTELNWSQPLSWSSRHMLSSAVYTSLFKDIHHYVMLCCLQTSAGNHLSFRCGEKKRHNTEHNSFFFFFSQFIHQVYCIVYVHQGKG